MGTDERIPPLPLAACILAGPVIASLLPGIFAAGSSPGDSFLRIWGTLALFGVCYAAVVGVPLALLLLRDPALPWRRWLGAGLLAGLITAALLLGWAALTSTRNLIHGQWAEMQVLTLWIVVPLVLFSAIVSRVALALWLGRSQTRL
jgi:ethanolamine transporter EutH